MAGLGQCFGATAAHPELPLLEIVAITQTPRKYGFHGTLRAPFRLQNGVVQQELEAELGRFAQAWGPVFLDGMEVADLHGFVALRPIGDTQALNQLAGDIVRTFDPLRAPLNESELARRLKAPLTKRQKAYLDDWGYPYVMEEFHYHMTLSGKLPSEQSARVAEVVSPLLEPLCPKPFAIDALTLLGEDDRGYFHQIHRYSLEG